MSHSRVARSLPDRPSLEHLKNEAKARLRVLRQANPRAKLSEVQFAIAREYGCSSWRELKSSIERADTDPQKLEGHWISDSADNLLRMALHVWSDPVTGLSAAIDVPDRGYFGDPAAIEFDGNRLSWKVLKASRGGPALEVRFDGKWDPASQSWAGNYTQGGKAYAMTFRRGRIPSAPVIHGLDGLWDGVLNDKDRIPLTFGIKTDEHGTRAWCDSPKGSGYGLAASSIRVDEDSIEIKMKTVVLSAQIDPAQQRIDGRLIRGELIFPICLTRRAVGAALPQSLLAAAREKMG
jgi:hypothetical protein